MLSGLRFWLLAGAAAVAFSSGLALARVYYVGQLTELENEYLAASLLAAERAKSIEVLLQDIKDQVQINHALREQKQKTVERIVTKEVLKYVSSPVANKCDLPVEFVRIHNTAAQGRVPEVPDATSRADDAASGITDVRLLEVVTENYSTCHTVRNDLISLQEWLGQTHTERTEF